MDHEHRVLLAAYGRAQRLCSERILAQQREIERLQAELFRSRAYNVMRDTQLAWANEDRQSLEAPASDAECSAPAVLCLEQGEGGQLLASHIAAHGEAATAIGDAGDDPALLEASLVAADLVICQTGCVSHDAYWRVEDHCRRTGKACVLVEQPQALQWVRMVRCTPATADSS